MSDGRGVCNTTPLQNENKRPGSNTGRGHDAGRQLRHGSGALHGNTRGSVVVLVGKLRKDVRCTSVTQFLKTLRVDTLWEREMGMCCCALVTKLTANCVSQILSRNARWVTSARTWTCLWRPLCSRGDWGLAWWPGLRCGVGSRVVAYGAVVVVQLRVDVKPPLYSCCVFFFVSLIF